MLRILIVDDEASNREALSEIVRRMGHEVHLAVDGHEALEKACATTFDMILSDVRMPRMDGLQFFESLRQLDSELPPFVFMTAYGRLEEAVEAIRKGALHFLTKPLRKKEIAAAIGEVEMLLVRGATRQLPGAKRQLQTSQAIYASRAFGDVVRLVDKVAPSLASVLFVGESGTGKEILARRLHEQSGRNQGPFVAFHSGAVPETLLESELFGYEKGAFTGADSSRAGHIRSAHHGTFFLDEISSMPIGIQTKLLRVLQDRKVTPLGGMSPIDCDVRWVAATNIELDSLVKSGAFREDLLFRLRVVEIRLPPLRERVEDIDVLAEHFVSEIADTQGRAPLQLPEGTRALLRRYPWPGNVRELRNVIERALALCDGEVLSPSLLPAHIAESQRSLEIRVAVGSTLESVEDRLIEETLRSCEGDKAQAAAILGIAPRTIYRWLEKHEAKE